MKYLLFKTKPLCKAMEMHKIFLFRIFAKNNYANCILFVFLMLIVSDLAKAKSKKVNIKVKK